MMNILNALTDRPLRFMMNALGGVSSMMVLLIAAPATASASGQSESQAHLYAGTGEAVYLVDSCSTCTTSVISRVFFHDGEDDDDGAKDDDGEKKVTLVELGEVDFEVVYSMGLTPDGKMLPLLQSTDGAIGVFNLETGTFTSTKFLKLDDGSPVQGVALAAFPPVAAPPYLAIIGSELTNLIYSSNPLTAEATSLGHVYVPAAGSTADDYLDLKGADLAFTANGHMYLWTNHSKTGSNGMMNQGLYRVDWHTSKDRYEGTRIEDDGDDFQADTTFITGLALRFNGRARSGGEYKLVGSVNNATWMQGFSVKVGSDAMKDTVEYSYSPEHLHVFGDMASAVGRIGTLPCTYSKGYWKNHAWEYTEESGFPGSVELCDERISESDGKRILRSAKNWNFSMLAAQLIAAKLNAGTSAIGLPIMDDIREAEAFLCEQTDGSWSKPFNRNLVIDGLTQKQWATDYKDDLEYFNKGKIKGLDHCD